MYILRKCFYVEQYQNSVHINIWEYMYQSYTCPIQYGTPKPDKEIKIRADESENTLKRSDLKETTLQVLTDLLIHKHFETNLPWNLNNIIPELLRVNCKYFKISVNLSWRLGRLKRNSLQEWYSQYLGPLKLQPSWRYSSIPPIRTMLPHFSILKVLPEARKVLTNHVKNVGNFATLTLKTFLRGMY